MTGRRSRLRLLFNAWADDEGISAQNLNARELAARMDPSRFEISIFHRRPADPRLVDRENIRLLRLPKRLAAFAMLRHMLAPYDAMLYLQFTRADHLFRRIGRRIGGPKAFVMPVESQLDHLDAPGVPDTIRTFYDDIARMADVLVANSPYVGQTFEDRYGRSTEVIVNGVEASFFRDLAEARRPQERERPLVVYAGSFLPRKHPELVLDLARRVPEADYILMGDGPLRGELEHKLQASDLGHVRIEPARGYEDYARRLVEADIFLFPSRSEGLPRVTLEAAAAGIPQILFNDYQAPSVAHGKTGYRVDTLDEMEECLRRLVTDADLRQRMSTAAFAHIEQYDWSRAVPRWEGIFEQACR